MFGIDFSSGSGITTAQLNAHGVGFVVRYISTPGNPKNISKAEFTNYMNAGIKVALVFETSAGRILSGFAGGQADAHSAQSQVSALGCSTIPVFFACDFDEAASQQPAINSYLDGAASVIGWNRTGIYGGFWPTSRAFKAGKVKFVWQTYAWSGGEWGRPNTHIEQYQNDVIMGPAQVDFDRSMQTDFGQWPRPSAPPPVPTPTPTPVPTPLPAPKPIGEEMYAQLRQGTGDPITVLRWPGAMNYTHVLLLSDKSGGSGDYKTVVKTRIHSSSKGWTQSATVTLSRLADGSGQEWAGIDFDEPDANGVSFERLDDSDAAVCAVLT